MRADRLLAILMLLQTRGCITARWLAKELEVSERTIYRDIEALSIAGIPVYAERGPGGGCRLLESYRTDLTGLKESEVQAMLLLSLYMLRIPAPLADLGVSQELKAALLKLSAALPASQRQEGERVRQRMYLDSTAWYGDDNRLPHLQVIHKAVWEDRRLSIAYRPRFGTLVERQVDPYGLVAKSNIWYLAAAREGNVRVYQISRIARADLCQDSFERPAGFDLETFWADWSAAVERARPFYTVVVRVAPELAPELPQFFGDEGRERIVEAGAADPDGRVRLTLTFESFEAARERILGFGRAVEVLEPEPLRKSVVDFAQQIINLYE
jgi:predicted DNA-binding transcriptional regulator YafY